jgi:2'-5' RNA ligase
MNTDSLTKIPGYKYNEYLLILSPHEDLRNKIMQIKKEFHEKYKAPTAVFSKPHITLVNFIQFEMAEVRLINRLKTIAAGYHSFKVDLNGFGSFPSHTIFINVESQQQVQNLGKEIRPAQQLMTLNKDYKPHFINSFHLTVARKLLPWQYEQGWSEYSLRHFSGCFMADGMLLLKISLEEKSYKIAERFDFMNLPGNATQGHLFV